MEKFSQSGGFIREGRGEGVFPVGLEGRGFPGRVRGRGSSGLKDRDARRVKLKNTPKNTKT